MGKFLSLVVFFCGIVLVLFGVNRSPTPALSASDPGSTASASGFPPFGWLLCGAAGVSVGLFGLTRSPNPA
ncbi:MAG: hypothetical protein U1F61_02015 [Opitutaceae bacterium]